MPTTVRVLFAEDEALIAVSLTDLLEAEGYEIHHVWDGIAALAMAQCLRGNFDLLVTDLNMPGMRGEELIRALRSTRPALPVVVVTGSAPAGGAEALQRWSGGHGPLALLHKPVAARDLLAALRRVTVATVP
ncbi:response regulator [Falsiroseomonas sp. HW251]|uniref:response regulator n=1 Tax=Falsiroseomonas sp. HW251 TaxID=3390998 RepID=UPI003D30FEC7